MTRSRLSLSMFLMLSCNSSAFSSSPSIGGGALAGRIQIATAANSARIEIHLRNGRTLTNDAGSNTRITFDDPDIRDCVDITASVARRSLRWTNVCANEIVLPDFDNNTAIVTQTIPLLIGTIDVARLGAPQRFFSTNFGAPEATFIAIDGTTFTATTEEWLALRDANHVLSFARGNQRFFAVGFPVVLPNVPVGYDRVVGVPGIGNDGSVSLFVANEAVLPNVVGTKWALAEAQHASGARSTAIARGSAPTTWPSFLAPPALRVVDGEWQITFAADGDLHILEVLDAANQVLASEWFFGPQLVSASRTIADGAAAARVRAFAFSDNSLDVRANFGLAMQSDVDSFSTSATAHR